MPLIFLPPPPPPVAARPLWGSEETCQAQGIEGRRVEAQLAEVWQHWHGRIEAVSSETQAVDENYRHLPFERVGSRRVRYRPTQPLTPRRFTFEDDHE